MQYINSEVVSAIQPKKPLSERWQLQGKAPVWMTLGYPGFLWFHPKYQLKVCSAVEFSGEVNIGPVYHISISKNRRRCSMDEAKMVLKQFDMEGADEDNHVPFGIVRNFFEPVAELLSGYVCPCKETEPKMVEDKGEYIWRG